MLYSDSVNTTGGLAKVYKQNIVISKIIEKGYRMLFCVIDISITMGESNNPVFRKPNYIFELNNGINQRSF